MDSATLDRRKGRNRPADRPIRLGELKKKDKNVQSKVDILDEDKMIKIKEKLVQKFINETNKDTKSELEIDITFLMSRMRIEME